MQLTEHQQWDILRQVVVMTPAPPTWFTVAEAQAKYFGGKMSLRWWYRAADTGLVPSAKIGGTVLFRRSDLEAFQKFVTTEKPTTHAPVKLPPPPKLPKPKPGTGLRFFRP